MLHSDAEDSMHPSCLKALQYALVFAEWSMAGPKTSKTFLLSVWEPKILVVCLRSKYLPEFSEPPDHFLSSMILKQLGQWASQLGLPHPPSLWSFILDCWNVAKTQENFMKAKAEAGTPKLRFLNLSNLTSAIPATVGSRDRKRLFLGRKIANNCDYVCSIPLEHDEENHVS